MRNIILMLVLLAFTQCTKESTSETNSTTSIIGKWQLVSSTYKRYKNKVVTQTGVDNINQVGYTIIFKGDGTAVATDISGAVEQYTYKISGNTIQLSAFGSSYVPFTVTSNKLVWVYWDGTTDLGTEVTETLNKIN
jgi:hypothetical protein